MLNKILICLLLILLLSSLNAQDGWSVPKLISTGRFNQTPNIIMDKNFVLHAFWGKADSIPVSNHGALMYSYSYDRGQSWSVPANISNNSIDRPILPEIVVDNDNNLHLFYQLLNSGKLVYQQKTNGNWSIATEIENYISSYHRVAIDSDDIIYLFWVIYGSSTNIKTHYRIKEKDTWSNDMILNDSLVHININNCKKGVIDLIGASVSNSPQLRAYYYKYIKSSNKVSDIYNISNGLSPSIGQSVTTDTQSNIHTLFSFTPNNSEDYVYYCKKSSNSWYQPIYLDDEMYHNGKELLVDSGGAPHAFNLSYNQDTLFHSFKVNDQWNIEKVAYDNSGNGYYIGEKNYKSVMYQNTIYLIYSKAKFADSKLYFTKKTLTNDISDEDLLKKLSYGLKNYPNPFNNTTRISFVLPQISEIKLEIFNAKGELVQSLFKGQLKSGQHDFNFNGTSLNSGVYYCRLTVGSDVKTTKLMLLK